MEVVELNVIHAEVDGEGAVFGSLEVHWHLATGFCLDHCVVFVVLLEVDLGIIFAEAELLEGIASVETEDGVVDH